MRLDSYLYENGYYSSRSKSAQAIERGQVIVNGVNKKASYEVLSTDKIEVIEKQKFVSEGGYKLEKALLDFGFNVTEKVCADIGASTGGFTDCLLQRGAKKVYAIDVGEGLLDQSLQANDRVESIQRLNARNLTENSLPEKVELATVDCSFISLKQVLGAIKSIVKPFGNIIALIKPQFECGRKNLSKNGIVIEPKARLEAVLQIYEFVLTLGLSVENFTTSPIKSGKNVEYLILIGNGEQMSFDKIKEVVLSKKN